MEANMHKSSMLRMEWFIHTYIHTQSIRVLDIGSWKIDGHACYKDLFKDIEIDYVGLDVSMGNNVDLVVENPYKWDMLENDSFDVVISGQAFEHIEFIWLTMQEIARVLKPNGFCCIIAPNGNCRHRVPTDCWRFYEDGMLALAKYVGFEPLHVSVNSAPANASEEWFSQWKDCILVAKKLNQMAESNSLSKVYNLNELNSNFLSFLEWQLLRNKCKVYVWGAGKFGKDTSDYLEKKGIYIQGFLDSNEKLWQKNEKYAVLSPNEILHKVKSNNMHIIISTAVLDIFKKCLDAGLEPEKDFSVSSCQGSSTKAWLYSIQSP
jgi:SAM-dependent methyltransferase